MLKIISTLKQLHFSQLMQVYAESNALNGREHNPAATPEEQILEAEQDFYEYLRAVFFRQKASFYAVWEVDGHYQSALRIEPYDNGMLLCALETAPDARRCGLACSLISAVQNYLSEQGSGYLYSHISKTNLSSLVVHQKCGFQIIKDYAIYSDGSVLHNCYTMAYVYKKSETI